jgi:hypothetical protein
MIDNTATAYTIGVRPKRQISDFFKLGEIPDVGTFNSIFELFLNERKSLQSVQAESDDGENLDQARLRRGWVLDDWRPVDRENFEGIYKTTLYGYGNDIIDLNSGKKVSELEKHLGVSYPLYFSFRAEPEATRGVLVLHRFGSLTAYPELVTRFSEWFKIQYPRLFLEISAVTSGKALAAYIQNSQVDTLEFRQIAKVGNPADALNPYRVASRIIRLRPPRGDFFPSDRLANVVSAKGRIDPEDVIEVLQGIDREISQSIRPDELAIDLTDSEGNKKTLNFSKQGFKEIYNFQNRVAYDEKGFMIKDCFIQEARIIIETVLTRLKNGDDQHDQ